MRRPWSPHSHAESLPAGPPELRTRTGDFDRPGAHRERGGQHREDHGQEHFGSILGTLDLSLDDTTNRRVPAYLRG